MKKDISNWLAALLLTSLMAGCGKTPQLVTYAEAQKNVEPRQPPVICRVFFQDHESKKLHWTELRQGEPPQLDAIRDIAEFPTLDSERQNLVQMEASRGTLMVGVRDDDRGAFQSGWVLLDTGVIEETHGDHGHWSFEEQPRVIASQLDDQQGNPAHLYLYQDVYYLANDNNDGYTRLDPAAIEQKDSGPAVVPHSFQAGGGHHITLAVAGGVTGYSSWIDGGGPNQGRVDVTRIKPEGNTEIAYSLTLPTGGIHGATAAADKVFFAPIDGVCWVTADPDPQPDHADAEIHHISLGEDPETNKPLRTGAFTTHRDYVCFVIGEEDYAALALLDAKSPSPDLITVPLPMKPGNSPTPPTIVKTANGNRLAFIFHNHPAEADGEEFLSVIDLDPDQDLDFSDARELKTLAVGSSAVTDHYGHHDISFDHAGVWACWTNPGDGTISLMSLSDLTVLDTVSVGGMPTKILLQGEQDFGH